MTSPLIQRAIDHLRDGDVVGLPTDTVYGIASDPFRESVVVALRRLKGRDPVKPLAVLVASMDSAVGLVHFTDRALDLAEEHWPGALTLVLRRLESVPSWIGDERARTVGVRSPDHPLTQELLGAVGPLVVTSANLSGDPPALDHEAAEAAVGDEVAMYLPGKSSGDVASTVVDMTQPTPLILRQGPVVVM